MRPLCRTLWTQLLCLAAAGPQDMERALVPSQPGSSSTARDTAGLDAQAPNWSRHALPGVSPRSQLLAEVVAVVPATGVSDRLHVGVHALHEAVDAPGKAVCSQVGVLCSCPC